MKRARLVLPAVLASILIIGCTGGGGMVEEAAINVVTLQRGTTSELRDRRGRGPFQEYPEVPEAMLTILERAMERAAGLLEQPPYVAVFVSKRYGEVIAKESERPEAGYGDPFRSAAIAIVHPSPRGFGWCRVEWHAVQRGPFHRGCVDWKRKLPGWIESARAAYDPLAPEEEDEEEPLLRRLGKARPLPQLRSGQ